MDDGVFNGEIFIPEGLMDRIIQKGDRKKKERKDKAAKKGESNSERPKRSAAYFEELGSYKWSTEVPIGYYINTDTYCKFTVYNFRSILVIYGPARVPPPLRTPLT